MAEVDCSPDNLLNGDELITHLRWKIEQYEIANSGFQRSLIERGKRVKDADDMLRRACGCLSSDDGYTAKWGKLIEDIADYFNRHES